MKSAKKILALILAGVMALALLTGCGKSTSLNRTIAEGFAESLKSSFANYYINNSDYLQKARKHGHFTGYKN